MIFAPPLHRVIEHVDRRVLGAFQLVDAVTNLPITTAAEIELRSATLVNGGPPEEVPVHERSLHLRQSRTGFHVILKAPFFDAYAASFDSPVVPAEVAGNELQLRLAVKSAGPHYLPQEFEFSLPRALDPAADDSVFQPVTIPLFRAPGAPVLDGWSVLRVRVTGGNPAVPLPGVLVRVYRSPRAVDDPPIGQGMTEWRGRLRGEGLVAVSDLPRFHSGGDPNDDVFVSTQPIHFEVTHDPNFTGAPDQLPNGQRLIAGGGGLVTRRSDPPPNTEPLAVDPPAPLDIQAAEEASVQLTMP